MTERGRMTQALADSEARLRAIVDHAPIGIAELDGADGRIVHASAHLATLLAASPARLSGASILALVAEPDRAGLAAELARVVAGGPAAAREVGLARSGGGVLEVRLTLAPLSPAGGRVIAAIEDLTFTLAATAQARAAEQRWAATIHASPLAIVVATLADGCILDVNPAFARLYGWSRAELLGQSSLELGMFVDPADRARLAEQVRDAGRGRVEAVRARRRDGEVRLIDGEAAPILLDDTPCLVTFLHDVTDAVRARERLDARERELREAFEVAPVGLVYGDLASERRLAVNQRFADMIGTTKEALLAATLSQFTHPADVHVDAGALRRLAEGADKEVRYSKRFVRVDGAVRCADVHVVAVPGPSGERSRFIVAAEDVTDQRRAEAAAREVGQRWSATVAAAHVAIAITVLPDHRVLDVNPACERLTGYARAELVGRPAAAVGLAVSPGRSAADAAPAEVIVQRKDGEVRRCEASTAPVVIDGQPSQLSVLSDLTDRRAAEAALAASEARYRELVENLEDAILSTDRDGVITFANAALARFGYAPAELLGTSVDRLLTPEDRPYGPRWRRALCEQPRPVAPHERMIVGKDGRLHPIRHAPRLVCRDGLVVGFTSVITDLTAQRQAEEQLRVAQRMEAIGRLAGGVAHDFNNLLTVILANLDLARLEVADDAPLAVFLDEVASAGKRAEALTKQLLAFSRKQLLVLEPLSLAAVVDGVSAMLRRLIGEDVGLSVHLPAGLPPVNADRGQLEQVLMNLVINSRDAMPDGGEIELGGRVIELLGRDADALQLAAGAYVELAVTDDGCGMDEATRARVFEPFFTTKPVGKGTGLGLATVYGIIQQLGGAITVESERDVGTTFRMYLPPVTAPAGPGEVAREPAVARASRGHECVVVVEDDAALRRVLRRLLTTAGYRVILCASPAEALAVCTAGAELDVMLTDVVMPGMNGRELVRRVHVGMPGLRVVYMSGYTDDALGRLDLTHGRLTHGRFLRKPFSGDELRRVIRETLDA